MEYTQKPKKFSKRDKRTPRDKAKKTPIAQVIILEKPHNIYFNKADHIIWCLENYLKKQTLSSIKRKRLEVVDIIFERPIPNFLQRLSNESSINPDEQNSNKKKKTESSYKLPEIRSQEFIQENIVDSLVTKHEKYLNEELDFIFTEDTYFYFIEEKYKYVFVIDVSDSMFSLDIETGKPLIDIAIETLEKTLNALIQSFTLNSSLYRKTFNFEPAICVSIIAFYGSISKYDYPEFKSYFNSIPDFKTYFNIDGMSEHVLSPCFKTILHSKYISSGKVSELIQSVSLDVKEYSRIIRKAKSHIYESRKKKENSSNIEILLNLDESFYEFPPLYELLEVAKYVLKLLPHLYSPGFMLITDGVIEPSFRTSDSLNSSGWFVNSNVKCSVIQVGSNNGFDPMVSLGNVVNNEFLRFVSEALSGDFFYSTDLPSYVIHGQINFFHEHFLVSRISLSNQLFKNRLRAIQTGLPRIGDIPREWLNTHPERPQRNLNNLATSFPWGEFSVSPDVETVIARYREYQMPVGLGIIIQARMKEGFVLSEIKCRPLAQSSYSNMQANDPHIEKNAVSVGEQIELIFLLRWFPNVTITYSVVSTFFPGNFSKIDSLNDKNALKRLSQRSQSFQNLIKINIRSYKLFTLLFLELSDDDETDNITAKKARTLLLFLNRIHKKDEKLKTLFSSSLLPQPYPSKISTSSLKKHEAKFDSDNESKNFNPQEKRVYKLLSYWVYMKEDWISLLSSFVSIDSIFLSSHLIEASLKNLPYTDLSNIGKDLLNEFIFENYLCGRKKNLSKYKADTGLDIDENVSLAYQFGSYEDSKSEIFERNQHFNLEFFEIGEGNNLSISFLPENMRLYLGFPSFVIAQWRFTTNWSIRITHTIFNGVGDAQMKVFDNIHNVINSFHSKKVVNKITKNQIGTIGILEGGNNANNPLYFSPYSASSEQISYSTDQYNSHILRSPYLYSNVLDSGLPEFNHYDSTQSFYNDEILVPIFKVERPVHLLLNSELDENSRMYKNPFETDNNKRWVEFASVIHSHKDEWEWVYMDVSKEISDLPLEVDNTVGMSDKEKAEHFQTLFRVAAEVSRNRLQNGYTILSASEGALKTLAGSTLVIDPKNLVDPNSAIDFLTLDKPEHIRDGFQISFYSETPNDDETLILSSIKYSVSVNLLKLSVHTELWIEPHFDTIVRFLFEEDVNLMVPITSFLKILKPRRKFELIYPKMMQNAKGKSIFAPISMLTLSRFQLRLLDLPSMLSNFESNSDSPRYLRSNAFHAKVPDVSGASKNHILIKKKSKSFASSSEISFKSSETTDSKKKVIQSSSILVGDNFEFNPNLEAYKAKSNPTNPEIKSLNSIDFDINSESRIASSALSANENNILSLSLNLNRSTTKLEKDISYSTFKSGSKSSSGAPKNFISESGFKAESSDIMEIDDNKSSSQRKSFFADTASSDYKAPTSIKNKSLPIEKINSIPSQNENTKTTEIFSAKTSGVNTPNSYKQCAKPIMKHTYILEKSSFYNYNTSSAINSESEDVNHYLSNELNPLILRHIKTSLLNEELYSNLKKHSNFIPPNKSLLSIHKKILNLDSNQLYLQFPYDIKSLVNYPQVLFRLYLEYSLFKYSDSLVVSDEKFYQLKFAGKIMQQLPKMDPTVRISTASPTYSIDNPLLDKWYVKRLQNQNSFLFISFPNIITTTGGKEFMLSRNKKIENEKKIIIENPVSNNKLNNNYINSINDSNVRDPSIEFYLDTENDESHSETSFSHLQKNTAKYSINNELDSRVIQEATRKNGLGINAGISTPQSISSIKHQNLQCYTLAFECSLGNEELRRQNISPFDIDHSPSFGFDFKIMPISVPKSLTPSTNDNDSSDPLSEPQVAAFSDEFITRNSCTADRFKDQGYAFSGCTSKAKNIPEFSSEAMIELGAIEKLYNKALVQSIFMGLMMGKTFPTDSLKSISESKHLNSCSIKFDITTFLHSFDISNQSKHFNPSNFNINIENARINKLNQFFEKAINVNFSSLNSYESTKIDSISSFECGKIYFCNPEEIKSYESNKLIDFSLDPLFISIGYEVIIKGEVLKSEASIAHKKDQLGEYYIDNGKFPISLIEACKNAGIHWVPSNNDFSNSLDVSVIMHIKCSYFDFHNDDCESNINLENENSSKVYPETSVVDINKLQDGFFNRKFFNSSLKKLKTFPMVQSKSLSILSNSLELYISRETLYNLNCVQNKSFSHLSIAWSIINISKKLEKVGSSKRISSFYTDSFDLHLTDILKGIDQMYEKETINILKDYNTFNTIGEINKWSGDTEYDSKDSPQSKKYSILDLFIEKLLSQNFNPNKLSKIGEIIILEIVEGGIDFSFPKPISKNSQPNHNITISSNNISFSEVSNYGAVPNFNNSFPVEKNYDIFEKNVENVVNNSQKVLTGPEQVWFMLKLDKKNLKLDLSVHIYLDEGLLEKFSILPLIEKTKTYIDQALKFTTTQLLLTQLSNNHISSDLLIEPGFESEFGFYESESESIDCKRKISLNSFKHRKSSFGSGLGGFTDIGAGVIVNFSSFENSQGTTKSQEDPDIISLVGGNVIESLGFYSCAEKFIAAFPIHSRINPNKMLNAIMNSNLGNSRIENKKNMYVFRSNDSIFYARMSVQSLPSFPSFLKKANSSSFSQQHQTSHPAYKNGKIHKSTSNVGANCQQKFANSKKLFESLEVCRDIFSPANSLNADLIISKVNTYYKYNLFISNSLSNLVNENIRERCTDYNKHEQVSALKKIIYFKKITLEDLQCTKLSNLDFLLGNINLYRECLDFFFNHKIRMDNSDLIRHSPNSNKASELVTRSFDNEVLFTKYDKVKNFSSLRSKSIKPKLSLSSSLDSIVNLNTSEPSRLNTRRNIHISTNTLKSAVSNNSINRQIIYANPNKRSSLSLLSTIATPSNNLVPLDLSNIKSKLIGNSRIFCNREFNNDIDYSENFCTKFNEYNYNELMVDKSLIKILKARLNRLETYDTLYSDSSSLNTLPNNVNVNLGLNKTPFRRHTKLNDGILENKELIASENCNRPKTHKRSFSGTVLYKSLAFINGLSKNNFVPTKFNYTGVLTTHPKKETIIPEKKSIIDLSIPVSYEKVVGFGIKKNISSKTIIPIDHKNRSNSTSSRMKKKSPNSDDLNNSSISPGTISNRNYLVLQLYGLDTPPEKMAFSLVEYISDWLRINVVLPELSLHLGRNSRLVQDDLEFIFSKNSKPITIYLPVPEFASQIEYCSTFNSNPAINNFESNSIHMVHKPTVNKKTNSFSNSFSPSSSKILEEKIASKNLFSEFSKSQYRPFSGKTDRNFIHLLKHNINHIIPSFLRHTSESMFQIYGNTVLNNILPCFDNLLTSSFFNTVIEKIKSEQASNINISESNSTRKDSSEHLNNIIKNLINLEQSNANNFINSNIGTEFLYNLVFLYNSMNPLPISDNSDFHIGKGISAIQIVPHLFSSKNSSNACETNNKDIENDLKPKFLKSEILNQLEETQIFLNIIESLIPDVIDYKDRFGLDTDDNSDSENSLNEGLKFKNDKNKNSISGLKSYDLFDGASRLESNMNYLSFTIYSLGHLDKKKLLSKILKIYWCSLCEYAIENELSPTLCKLEHTFEYNSEYNEKEQLNALISFLGRQEIPSIPTKSFDLLSLSKGIIPLLNSINDLIPNIIPISSSKNLQVDPRSYSLGELVYPINAVSFDTNVSIYNKAPNIKMDGDKELLGLKRQYISGDDRSQTEFADPFRSSTSNHETKILDTEPIKMSFTEFDYLKKPIFDSNMCSLRTHTLSYCYPLNKVLSVGYHNAVNPHITSDDNIFSKKGIGFYSSKTKNEDKLLKGQNLSQYADVSHNDGNSFSQKPSLEEVYKLQKPNLPYHNINETEDGTLRFLSLSRHVLFFFSIYQSDLKVVGYNVSSLFWEQFCTQVQEIIFYENNQYINYLRSISIEPPFFKNSLILGDGDFANIFAGYNDFMEDFYFDRYKYESYNLSLLDPISEFRFIGSIIEKSSQDKNSLQEFSLSTSPQLKKGNLIFLNSFGTSLNCGVKKSNFPQIEIPKAIKSQSPQVKVSPLSSTSESLEFINPSEVAEILNNSRVLLSVTEEIIFAEHFHPIEYNVKSINSHFDLIGSILKNFRNEYIKYLKSIGMRVVQVSENQIPTHEMFEILKYPNYVREQVKQESLQLDYDLGRFRPESLRYRSENSNNSKITNSSRYNKISKLSTPMPDSIDYSKLECLGCIRSSSRNYNTINRSDYYSSPKVESVKTNSFSLSLNRKSAFNGNDIKGINFSSNTEKPNIKKIVGKNDCPIYNSCETSNPGSDLSNMQFIPTTPANSFDSKGGDSFLRLFKPFFKHTSYLIIATSRSFLIVELMVNPNSIQVKMSTTIKYLSSLSTHFPGYTIYQLDKKPLKQYSLELSKIKNLLNLKPFIYDFQLRLIIEALKPMYNKAYNLDYQIGGTRKTEDYTENNDESISKPINPSISTGAFTENLQDSILPRADTMYHGYANEYKTTNSRSINPPDAFSQISTFDCIPSQYFNSTGSIESISSKHSNEGPSKTLHRYHNPQTSTNISAIDTLGITVDLEKILSSLSKTPINSIKQSSRNGLSNISHGACFELLPKNISNYNKSLGNIPLKDTNTNYQPHQSITNSFCELTSNSLEKNMEFRIPMNSLCLNSLNFQEYEIFKKIEQNLDDFDNCLPYNISESFLSGSTSNMNSNFLKVVMTSLSCSCDFCIKNYNHGRPPIKKPTLYDNSGPGFKLNSTTSASKKADISSERALSCIPSLSCIGLHAILEVISPDIYPQLEYNTPSISRTKIYDSEYSNFVKNLGEQNNFANSSLNTCFPLPDQSIKPPNISNKNQKSIIAKSKVVSDNESYENNEYRIEVTMDDWISKGNKWSKDDLRLNRSNFPSHIESKVYDYFNSWSATYIQKILKLSQNSYIRDSIWSSLSNVLSNSNFHNFSVTNQSLLHDPIPILSFFETSSGLVFISEKSIEFSNFISEGLVTNKMIISLVNYHNTLFENGDNSNPINFYPKINSNNEKPFSKNSESQIDSSSYEHISIGGNNSYSPYDLSNIGVNIDSRTHNEIFLKHNSVNDNDFKHVNGSSNLSIESPKKHNNFAVNLLDDSSTNQAINKESFYVNKEYSFINLYNPLNSKLKHNDFRKESTDISINKDRLYTLQHLSPSSPGYKRLKLLILPSVFKVYKLPAKSLKARPIAFNKNSSPMFKVQKKTINQPSFTYRSYYIEFYEYENYPKINYKKYKKSKIPKPSWKSFIFSKSYIKEAQDNYRNRRSSRFCDMIYLEPYVKNTPKPYLHISTIKSSNYNNLIKKFKFVSCSSFIPLLKIYKAIYHLNGFQLNILRSSYKFQIYHDHNFTKINKILAFKLCNSRDPLHLSFDQNISIDAYNNSLSYLMHNYPQIEINVRSKEYIDKLCFKGKQKEGLLNYTQFLPGSLFFYSQDHVFNKFECVDEQCLHEFFKSLLESKFNTFYSGNNYFSADDKISLNRAGTTELISSNWLKDKVKLFDWKLNRNISRLLLMNPFSSDFAIIIWLIKSTTYSNMTRQPESVQSHISSTSNNNTIPYFYISKNINFYNTHEKEALPIDDYYRRLSNSYQYKHNPLNENVPKYMKKSNNLVEELLNSKNDINFDSDYDSDIELYGSKDQHLQFIAPTNPTVQNNSIISGNLHNILKASEYSGHDYNSGISLKYLDLEASIPIFEKSDNTKLSRGTIDNGGSLYSSEKISASNQSLKPSHLPYSVDEGRKAINSNSHNGFDFKTKLNANLDAHDVFSFNKNFANLDTVSSTSDILPSLKIGIKNIKNSHNENQKNLNKTNIFNFDNLLKEDSTNINPQNLLSDKVAVPETNTSFSKIKARVNSLKNKSHASKYQSQIYQKTSLNDNDWKILDLACVSRMDRMEDLYDEEKMHLNAVLSIISSDSLLNFLPHSGV
ncbi:hypothetical protein AYI69_g5286 [Smittium culicis]|uniref:Uncharacterized protein n=2 Tax=Smittium culicis TaxID=133412 RepID=A0A1R1Y7D0_9FUNG|nr:hypothetical protein AYI69_g5286 [Smittium culicis]